MSIAVTTATNSAAFQTKPILRSSTRDGLALGSALGKGDELGPALGTMLGAPDGIEVGSVLGIELGDELGKELGAVQVPQLGAQLVKPWVRYSVASWELH